MTALTHAKLFELAFRNLSFTSASAQSWEDPRKLGRASLYFPLVGFIFGLLFMSIFTAVSGFVNMEWACLVVLVAMVAIFTGRQYQSCLKLIAMFGEKKKNQKTGSTVSTLDIVQVVFIFGVFMLKFLSLTHLGKGWILGMLIIVPVISCWSKVYLCHSLSFDVPEKGESSYMRFVGSVEFWGATIFTTLVVGMIMGLQGLFLLILVSLWTAILERWTISKPPEALQFCLGLIMELNENLLLLVLIAMRKGFALSVGDGVWL